MSRALKDVALVALLGVLVASAAQGRTWLLGGAVLLLVLARAAFAHRAGAARAVTALAPCLAGLAVLGLTLQTVGVVVNGDLGRSAGFLPHANTAAATTLALWTLLVVTGSQIASGGGPAAAAWRGALVAGSVASGLLLLAAGSRSLLLGLLLGIVVAVSVRRGRPSWRRTLPRLGVAVAALCAGLVAIARLRPDVDSVLGSFERGPIFSTALGIAALSPWTGLGDGAWTRWAPVVEPSLPLAAAVHTHSVLLEALVGGGAVGLAATLVLFALGARRLLTQQLEHGSLAGGALVVGVVALTVQGLVDLAVLYPGVYAPLVLAAASWDVTQGARTRARKERGHGEQRVQREPADAASD